MNTLFDKIIAALKIAESNGSNETVIKELAKQGVKNQNFPIFHENNLIAIIEEANNLEQLILGITGYIQANS
ncbi:MAG: hypothetical protein J1G38_00290 [Clostridiales bacterium]|nr:hypothetical protein [Clostridiales bacterium]